MSDLYQTMSHIIIAEDEDTTRWMLVRAIQLVYPHVHISAVQDGYAAWLLYKQQGADLVIADACMPIMDGLELILMIRACSSYTPIILVSGKLPIKDRLFERTHLYILSKPFDWSTFLGLVTRALHALVTVS